jgi:hypothetical protein
VKRQQPCSVAWNTRGLRNKELEHVKELVEMNADIFAANISGTEKKANGRKNFP